MKLPIHNINEMKISGVSIQLNPQENEYKERYFQWTPYNLKTSFNGQEIISGRLIGWHHAPVFTEVETHGSDEMFFFTHGECIMIFCDLKNGIPALETVQLARIPAGTQVRLTPGESITICPYLYHDFTVEPGSGPVLLGEVSQCNDDNTDNRFYEQLGRFPTIEEDEPPYRLLCSEYPAARE